MSQANGNRVSREHICRSIAWTLRSQRYQVQRLSAVNRGSLTTKQTTWSQGMVNRTGALRARNFNHVTLKFIKDKKSFERRGMRLRERARIFQAGMNVPTRSRCSHSLPFQSTEHRIKCSRHEDVCIHAFPQRRKENPFFSREAQLSVKVAACHRWGLGVCWQSHRHSTTNTSPKHHQKNDHFWMAERPVHISSGNHWQAD